MNTLSTCRRRDCQNEATKMWKRKMYCQEHHDWMRSLKRKQNQRRYQRHHQAPASAPSLFPPPAVVPLPLPIPPPPMTPQDLKEEKQDLEARLRQIQHQEQKLAEQADVGMLYIVHPREFLDQPIYKIGRTTNGVRRMNQYARNSEIELMVSTSNITNLEKIAKIVFASKFIPRREYGIEYFEGSIHLMRDEIMDLLNRYP